MKANSIWIKVLLAVLLMVFLAPMGFRLSEVLITLQTFIIFVLAGALGSKPALIATSIYVLLGALGLPVFGGYTAGWEKLIGDTAGFIWAFPVVAYGLGRFCETREPHFLNYLLSFFTAHIVLIVIGLTVLKMMAPSVQLFDTVRMLIPGLLLKTVIGGLLASYVVRRFNLFPKDEE
jgi:biotin transport system substrate-specific component